MGTTNDLAEAAEIEQWIAEAEAAQEPGTAQGVISKDIAGEGIPAKYGSLKSAGYTKVYHTETGAMSLCNNNMLRQQLGKKLPNGQRAFSVHPIEGIEPVRATYPCWLHPDNPEREEYDKMGFSVCTSNLKNAYEAERHTKNRHKIEYAAILRMREEKSKQEERDFQRGLYAALAGKANSDNPSDRLDVMTSDEAQEAIVAEVMDRAEATLYESPNPRKQRGRKKK